MPQEKERVLSSEHTQITFTADAALMEKLQQLKNLLAHQNPDPNYNELIHLIADVALKKLTPAPPAEKPRVMTSTTRFTPVNVKRVVWRRDHGQCTYPGYSSSYMLEYDHIVPYAKGGQATVENLRLLCRTHNQLKGASTSPRSSRGTPASRTAPARADCD